VHNGEEFTPVMYNAVISEIMISARWSGLNSDSSNKFWESAFLQAHELLKFGEYRPDLPEVVSGKLIVNAVNQRVRCYLEK
jgi:hypothetical protein